jgi:hypothetical protein
LAAIDAAETALAAEQAKLTHYTTCVLVNARQCVEIDTLKEQLAEANATIERLSAPVSDEEMRAHSVKIHNQEGQHAWLLDRGMVDALNAARKAAQ